MTANELLDRIAKDYSYAEIRAALDVKRMKTPMPESEATSKDCVLMYNRDNHQCEYCIGSRCGTHWVTISEKDGIKTGVCTA